MPTGDEGHVSGDRVQDGPGIDFPARHIIAATLEREIIPRLLLNTRAVAEAARPERPERLAPDDPGIIDRFCQVLAKVGIEPAMAEVEARLSAGVRVDDIFLGLLSPAARRLGALWEEDGLSFMDVTVALCRLEQMVHALAPRFAETPVEPARQISEVAGMRVLLAPAPGEQHRFGLLMVEEFMRRAGAEVTGLALGDGRQIVDAVAVEWFDVVGLSLSNDNLFREFPGLVGKIRAESCNQNLFVMVGGGAFQGDHAKARGVGADSAAVDAQDAVAQLMLLARLDGAQRLDLARSGGNNRGNRRTGVA